MEPDPRALLGVTAGILFAAKPPRWWMFPLVAALSGTAIFILSMPLWLDSEPSLGGEIAGFLLIYSVPTFMIAIASRAGWGRSAIAGLVTFATTMLASALSWWLQSR
jgi:hypothetical protein